MKFRKRRDRIRRFSPVYESRPYGEHDPFEESLKALCRGVVFGLAIVVLLGLSTLAIRAVVFVSTLGLG